MKTSRFLLKLTSTFLLSVIVINLIAFITLLVAGVMSGRVEFAMELHVIMIPTCAFMGFLLWIVVWVIVLIESIFK
jgi:hypothetical protein